MQYLVDTFELLNKALEEAKSRNNLSLSEVKCSIGARDALGRPTTTAMENKKNFMAYLKTISICNSFATVTIKQLVL